AALRMLQEAITKSTNPMQRFEMQYALATELLQSGQVESCLNLLSNMLNRASPAHIPAGASNRRQVRLLQGLAFLRLGELDNCLQHHNPDSCLIPIRGLGQHTERRGAANAEAIFAELAGQKTNDLGSRWLLNVAAMTLGHYPEGVPSNLVIPPSVFNSDYP